MSVHLTFEPCKAFDFGIVILCKILAYLSVSFELTCLVVLHEQPQSQTTVSVLSLDSDSC